MLLDVSFPITFLYPISSLLACSLFLLLILHVKVPCALCLTFYYGFLTFPAIYTPSNVVLPKVSAPHLLPSLISPSTSPACQCPPEVCCHPDHSLQHCFDAILKGQNSSNNLHIVDNITIGVTTVCTSLHSLKLAYLRSLSHLSAGNFLSYHCSPISICLYFPDWSHYFSSQIQ